VLATAGAWLRAGGTARRVVGRVLGAATGHPAHRYRHRARRPRLRLRLLEAHHAPDRCAGPGRDAVRRRHGSVVLDAAEPRVAVYRRAALGARRAPRGAGRERRGVGQRLARAQDARRPAHAGRAAARTRLPDGVAVGEPVVQLRHRARAGLREVGDLRREPPPGGSGDRGDHPPARRAALPVHELHGRALPLPRRPAALERAARGPGRGHGPRVAASLPDAARLGSRPDRRGAEAAVRGAALASRERTSCCTR